MQGQKTEWSEGMTFILATAGLIGVVLAFNINLARYKLLLGQISALSLFTAYTIGFLYQPRQDKEVRLFDCDLSLLLFLVYGLISYYFVDVELKDASWTTWFKFFIYALFYWSLTHGLRSSRLIRRLLDIWIGVTILLCIFGFSQYLKIDFFFILRPANRIFSASGNADLYVSYTLLLMGLLWGVFFYYYQAGKKSYLIAIPLIFFSYIVLTSNFGPIFPKELADRRIFSTFGNANMYSAYLVLVVLVALGLLIDSVVKQEMGRFWFYLSACLLVIANLILTQTRAGFMAVILGLVIFIFILIYSMDTDTSVKVRTFIRIISIGLIMSLLLVVAIRFAAPSIYDKAVSVIERPTARMYVYLGAIRMIGAYPVFGSGIGTFAIVYPDFRPPELDIYHPKNVSFVRHAHNEFLEIGAEQGLLGLGLFLWLLFAFYKTVLKEISYDHQDRFVLIGLLSGISALLLHSMVSVDMRFVSSAYFFWMSIAFSLILATPSPQMAGIAVEPLSKRKRRKEMYQSQTRPVNLLSYLKIVISISLIVWLGYNTNNLIRPFRAGEALKHQADFFGSKNDKELEVISALEEQKKKGKLKSRDYFRLGNLYAKRNQWSQAIENLENAVKIDPNLFGALNNLGNIAFMHQRPAEAVKYYRQAVLALAKKKTLTEREQQEINDARFNQGFAHFKMGDLEYALELFNQVLKADPNHAKALKMRERLIE